MARAVKRAAQGVTVYYNPATGKELGRETNTGLSAMPRIMEKARTAQREWASLAFARRKRRVRAIRDYLVAHADEIAAVISENSGKTRIDALATEVIPSALQAGPSCGSAERHASSVMA